MDYAELPLPPALDGLVAAVWTLAQGGDPAEWIEQEATPDGCVELIRRSAGRSAWGSDQPEIFATGLSEHPIRFGFSGDAAFVGIKLWPWAWEALGGPPCPGFADDWIAVESETPLAALLAGGPADIPARLVEALAEVPPHPGLLAAGSVDELCAATGLTPRQLQRWFERHIGLSPRSWLRLLRFRETLLAVQQDGAALAGHAAERGYSDQAHMTRDFRDLAGEPPGSARGRAKGPFLPG